MDAVGSHALRAAAAVCTASMVACVQAPAGFVEPGTGCVEDSQCAGGEICLDGACRHLCNSASDCDAGMFCRDGSCLSVTEGCVNAEECVAPGLCQTVTGVSCVGGVCQYPVAANALCDDGDPCTADESCTSAGDCVGTQVTCDQGTPIQVCRAPSGTCDPSRAPAGCLGSECCAFDPIWPVGSTASQPSCPMFGEDDGDGVEGAGESWTGVCEHDGGCPDCTDSAQCDDSNVCTADACVANYCTTTPMAGAPCTVNLGNDGECWVSGGAVGCRLARGQTCAVDADCASERCVCSNDVCSSHVCHESGCSTCQWDNDGMGSCQQTSAGNFGDGCNTPGMACSATGMCRAASGVSCTGDSECASGNCECAGAQCAGKLCSDADCDCTYNLEGDTICDGFLAYGVDDPDNTCGALACNGNGACSVDQGVSCTLNTDCGTGFCADGHCCNSACLGNCDRCDLSGSLGFCGPDDTACTGNCDRCGTLGNCEANDAACSGNCDVCSGSGNSFTCAANSALCTGNCDVCSGSGTAFSCAASDTMCTGNCGRCSGSGNTFDCQAVPALCTGNCASCSGSGTVYSCSATPSFCTGDCSTCSGSGINFSCSTDQALCGNSCDECAGSGTAYFCVASATGSSGSPTCAPYLCGGTSFACPASCTSSAACSGVNECCGGVCRGVASNSCAAPTILGSFAAGGGTTSSARWQSSTSQERWYTVTFNPNYDVAQHGTGMPTLAFARNDNSAFRFDIYTPACASAPTAALTDWAFSDNCSTSTSCKTRTVSWPATVLVRVTKVTPGATCEAFQLQVSR